MIFVLMMLVPLDPNTHPIINILNIFLTQNYTSIPGIIRRNSNLIILCCCDNYSKVLAEENCYKNVINRKHPGVGYSLKYIMEIDGVRKKVILTPDSKTDYHTYKIKITPQ